MEGAFDFMGGLTVCCDKISLTYKNAFHILGRHKSKFLLVSYPRFTFKQVLIGIGSRNGYAR